MEREQEITLTQMRKSVEKLGSSSENFGDLTLMRFLIARSMDPEKAAKMFVQWQKWRTTMVPNGFIADSEVPDELEPRKIFLQGLSKDGFPVLIVQARKHIPSKDSLQFKKFVVHLLDKTIASSFRGREIGNEKLIGIFDLQQISYKNIDARGLITGFQFLQFSEIDINRVWLGMCGLNAIHFKALSHLGRKAALETYGPDWKAYYPERLAKLYIVHMPRFFVSVWKMVSRFLEKATLEKIMIVTNDEEMKDVVEEIGEEVLPEEYGGLAKLVAFQDVTVPPLDAASS